MTDYEDLPSLEDALDFFGLNKIDGLKGELAKEPDQRTANTDAEWLIRDCCRWWREVGDKPIERPVPWLLAIARKRADRARERQEDRERHRTDEKRQKRLSRARAIEALYALYENTRTRLYAEAADSGKIPPRSHEPPHYGQLYTDFMSHLSKEAWRLTLDEVVDHPDPQVREQGLCKRREFEARAREGHDRILPDFYKERKQRFEAYLNSFSNGSGYDEHTPPEEIF